jgi:hypothetical protein
MNEVSRKFEQRTCGDSVSAISSPAAEPGVTPCGSPDGPMTDLFGREVAPVRVSAPLEKVKGLQTLATSGHIGHPSSGSAALHLSLESRLHQRLDTAGSTLFTLTWKRRRTPLGRPYLERAASVRRTSGSGCTSLGTVNTPQATDFHTGQAKRVFAPEGQRHGRRNNDLALLAGVPTPKASDGQGGRTTKTEGGGNSHLDTQAKLATVTTPSARDWKDTSGMSETGVDPDGSIRSRLDQLPRQAQLAASGPTATGGTAKTASIGQLNPEYSRWLMGLPIEFSNCADMAMQSVRRSRQSSSEPRKKP